MALEFLCDADVGDAELVIRLDLAGLHALLKTLATAVEARLDQVRLEGGQGAETAETAEGDAPKAFGRVTVSFIDSAAGGERRDPAIAGGARGSGETACWEMKLG